MAEVEGERKSEKESYETKLAYELDLKDQEHKDELKMAKESY